MKLVRRISSDRSGSSGINWWLRSWLTIVTSGGWIFWKTELCISSNPDVIITGILGLRVTAATVDLLPIMSTENLGMSADFSGLRIWIEGGWFSCPSINRGRSVRENHLPSPSKKTLASKPWLLLLLRRYVVLSSFHPMEGGEGEGGTWGNGDRVLSSGEFRRCVTLDIMKWMLRRISHLDHAANLTDDLTK